MKIHPNFYSLAKVETTIWNIKVWRQNISLEYESKKKAAGTKKRDVKEYKEYKETKTSMKSQTSTQPSKKEAKKVWGSFWISGVG